MFLLSHLVCLKGLLLCLPSCLHRGQASTGGSVLQRLQQPAGRSCCLACWGLSALTHGTVSFLLYAGGFWLCVHIQYGSRGGSPGGSVVKHLPVNAGDVGLIPGPGRSHVPRGTEALVPRACAPQQEKPPTSVRSPRSTTRERLHTETKAQCSQKSSFSK